MGKIKDIKENGYYIHKNRDTMLYTYDSVYTSGMNTQKKNGKVLPELYMIGETVDEGEIVFNALIKEIMKNGISDTEVIYTNINKLEEINVLLVKIHDLKSIFKELKGTHTINQKISGKGLRSVYQVVLSDVDKNFNFDETPLCFFDKKMINLDNIKVISA